MARAAEVLHALSFCAAGTLRRLLVYSFQNSRCGCPASARPMPDLRSVRTSEDFHGTE